MTEGAEELRPGTRVGPYLVEARLAEGGMATLWRARVEGEPEPVVLKTMLPHVARQPESADMFAREATLGAQLAHPNIVPIHDLGVLDGRPFIEMPLIEGTSLRQLLRSHLRAGERFPLDVALIACSEAADALAHLHDFPPEGEILDGLVHRDVSPENLLVGVDGRTRLLDFGVATADVASWTQVGQIKGKLHYMAPEVFKGAGAGPARDIHALGVTLFELVAGRRPYRAASEAELMYAISEGQPPPLTELRPDLPERLVDLVRDALASEPEARGDAVEFGERARALLDELGVTEEPQRVAACVRAWRAPPEAAIPPEVESSAPRSRAADEEDIFTFHRRHRAAAGESSIFALFDRRGSSGDRVAPLPSPPMPGRMNPEASRHFERGLDYKRRGLLEATLGEWELAAQLDPESRVIRTNLRRIKEKLRR